MQIYGMQCLKSSRIKISFWLSHENSDEDKNETNGQKEKIIRLQSDMNSDDMINRIFASIFPIYYSTTEIQLLIA